MKAVSVFPGKSQSVHLREVPKPSLDQVPSGRGVLAKVLRVGVDGTDKEINAAEYGCAPPGDDSTHSTTAFSGGFRYNPTRSRISPRKLSLLSSFATHPT